MGTQAMTPRFQSVTPRGSVSDVEVPLKFYVDRLGFTLAWTWGNPITHASVSRDSVALDLIASPVDWRATATAYVQLGGVERLFRGAQSEKCQHKRNRRPVVRNA